MDKIMKDCKCMITLDDGTFFCKYYLHKVSNEIPCNENSKDLCNGYEKED